MKKGLCRRCGFPVPSNQAVRSKFTTEIYCGNVSECDKRCKNELTLQEIEWRNKQVLKEIKCL